MKSTFRIIVLVLVAAFSGCQKSDVSVDLNSSVSSDGAFSGTIVNDSNRIDSIKVYHFSNNEFLGKSSVSSTGKFSLALTNPVLSKTGTFPNGIVISDTTAMVGAVFVIDAYSGTYNGTVYKANCSIFDSIKAGNSGSDFIYSDRAFSIKGTGIYADTTDGVTSNLKLNYNVTFKKGWNEYVWRVDSYSHTSTTETEVETYSNTVSSDLQWRCNTFSIALLTIHDKTRGALGVARPGFLFR